MPDFLPRRDLKLLEWSRNFTQRVEDAWQTWGVAEQDVLKLAAAQRRFDDAMTLVLAPATQAPPYFTEKDAARGAFETIARSVARYLRANLAITNADLANLGLRERRPRRGAIPVPDHAPNLHVRSIDGLRVTLKLRDATSPRRGKPRDVASAHVFIYRDDPRTAPEPRAMMGTILTSRPTLTVELPADTAPGTPVYFAARWCNPRHEPGPMSNAVVAHAGYGIAVAKVSESRRAA